MNNYEKFLFLLAIVLFAVAIAISLPSHEQQKNETVEDAMVVKGKQIIYNAINFGYNKSNYLYRYVENDNGYAQEYVLMKKDGDVYVWIDDQIGIKKIYLMGNQSFLCVEYRGAHECSETTFLNETALLNYYAYLNSKFFNDETIEKDKVMFDDFFAKGHVYIKRVSESTKYGKKCTLVEYTLDYTNMSVSDAAKYGIFPDMPKHFDWAICEANNIPFYRYFYYDYKGASYYNEFIIKDFDKAEEFIPPENLSEGAYLLLIDEMQAQGQLIECFRKSNATDKEKCISLVAFRLAKPNLCSFAGKEADRCIVRLISYIKEDTWCEKVVDSNFKEDCYIELAGALKNSSYCNHLLNTSKIEFCMNVSSENHLSSSTQEQTQGGQKNNVSSFTQPKENTTNTSSANSSEIATNLLNELEKSNKSEER